MREIFTSIDIGTESIKVATIEQYNEKFNVLAASCVKSAGIKQGLIIDASLASNALKKAIKSVESKLDTKIDKALAIIPSNNIAIYISEAEIKVPDGIVNGNDMFSCAQHSLKNKSDSNMEIVDVIPIEYRLNKNKKVLNPLGLEAENLEMKCVIVSVPKKNVYSVVSLIQNAGIEVMDITITSIADYYASKVKELDSKVVSVVDIGLERTIISIFNKGVIIKESILPIGSINIDDAIGFSYKTDILTSKQIKEDFAVANRKYADAEETYNCVNRLGKNIVINQYRIAELIENKSVELLKNIKNEINNLTNKEIGYIIITGGITSMLGFNAIVEQLFTRNATVMNLGVIGIRNNKYSSCYGAIIHFVEKLNMREKEYTMFDDSKVSEMLATRKKPGSGNVLGKIFDKIFD